MFLYLGKKIADGKGLGGAGRLTIARIDTIQNFYGLAIRENKGNARGMAKATKAILYHYASSRDNPKHDFCPEGSPSWCSYQRDVAKGTNFHQPIKNPLPPAVVKVLQPVFNRLGDEKFLAGCVRCATQNANESLHHVVWGIAPKDQYISQTENSTALSLAVLIFNSGMEVTFSLLMPMLELTVSPTMLKAWENVDEVRIYGAEYKDKPEVKARRKELKRNKVKKAAAFVHDEGGPQYKSQGFYTDGNENKGRGKGKGVPAQGTEKKKGRGKGKRKGS